jgi:hypothetical protein
MWNYLPLEYLSRPGLKPVNVRAGGGYLTYWRRFWPIWRRLIPTGTPI